MGRVFKAFTKVGKKKDNFLNLWEKVMEKLSKEELEIAIVTMKKVWIRKNEFIFEESFKSSSKVILLAKVGLAVFRKHKWI